MENIIESNTYIESESELEAHKEAEGVVCEGSLEPDNQLKPKQKRKLYFRALKGIMRVRYKEPTFVFLGEEIGCGAVILSNHEGTDAPMAMEIYLNRPLRMWGTAEMNSGLKHLYKYQTEVYYHEKKNWNIHLARLFCLLASPLTYLFYSGLDLISTYQDIHFVRTIRESISALDEGDNVVIYPECSDKGYLPELEGFHGGFVTFADICRKRGRDIKIFVSYFRKSDNLYIIDEPIMYSELYERIGDRDEISAWLCNRCNELGKMEFETNKKEGV